MPEEFNAREAFTHVVDALEAQAGLLRSLDAKQDAQEAHLASVDAHLASLDRKQDAVIDQLRELNGNIVRGCTETLERTGDLTRRVE